MKTIFPDANLRGCCFHFIKALWNKAWEEGLIKKIKNIDIHILIFAYKSEYKNFINYFVKNWYKCNFLNFENFEQDEIEERTDNIWEIFHKNLYKLFGINHPKISFLVEKLKEYTQRQFENLLINIVSEKDKY